ncbi:MULTISPECIES: endonuclease MutS2 [unclassified Nitratiruptor]|uniref:endonuclease MutS2 n=1 Tax=unclassified Nitratiruptor TaxID=2624044 RepID=UPI00191647B8|nr:MULTISPECIES: endonuclease MutS2 [unclassified Nitratiruptor]BCD60575.1 DNA mismatch repair protein MutS2 [Nitratiruptor sp. YY08-10]BCD64506.1 DNA mismatch repair protein MutS2 [Nitratiruptor sp. YY08-14]
MDLEKKLDLTDFLDQLRDFFARPKPLSMEGDVHIHYEFLMQLCSYTFKEPPKVQVLDDALMRLKKQGVLTLSEIFEFVKIVRYFTYLKSLEFEGSLGAWLQSIEIPEQIDEITNYFDEKGNIKSEIDERLVVLDNALSHTKTQIRQKLQALINAKKLQSYLVDRQIHFVGGEEALLVRGGFNHVLKATVIGRSSGGFFYVLPQEIKELKSKEADLLSQMEEIHYEIKKSISALFNKHLKFLQFINRAFDRFDHYQARVRFAKAKNLHIILPKSDNKIILKSFAHPAIEHPKPVDLVFDKKVLIVTGVNAGGKTMLLKSILASAYMAKYLIPMQCDPKSHIGRFKEIVPIIEDPQNVKNDISTFAGRMLEFSRLFSKNHLLVGVDEIELGTDSDEAATLFKVIIEELMKKDIKIAITTHHKRLASLMAAHEDVELVAAMYDEEKGVPTYEFLQGIIGKSYAFETARRYGIPLGIVQRAKKEYGEDQEKLSELIERGSELERALKEKNQKLDLELSRVTRERMLLQEEREKFHEMLKNEKRKLEQIYQEAVSEAKKALRAKEEKELHRHLTKAAQIAKSAKLKEKEPEELKVGDSVKYRKTKGVILSIRGKEAMIEADGMKLRVPLSELKRSSAPQKKKSTSKVRVNKPKALSVKLDLHGLRVEEALEKTDKFLSDALLAGFDEVLIYHGVGSGKLARAVREFLKKHPRVVSYEDAPPQMGGFGATVVKL